jgi:hypothetical protein
MAKRVAASPKRGSAKKSCSLVPSVVKALTGADCLPGDLKELYKLTLPATLDTIKADRHGFEVELVDQAEKSLATVLAALEEAHSTALKEQNIVIAKEEQDKRAKTAIEAAAAAEDAKAKLAASKAAQSSAQQVLNDAQLDSKKAKKEVTKAEQALEAQEEKTNSLSQLLAGEFAALQAGTKDKKVIKKAEAFGKEYKVDATLLQAILLACKKDAAARSEFENISIAKLKATIEAQIETEKGQVAHFTALKAEKAGVADVRNAEVEKAETASTAATEALTAAQGAYKEAQKAARQADDSVEKLWGDRKKACNTQDRLAREVVDMKENILTAFAKLKEKEPEPEPVEEVAAETVAEMETEAAAPEAAAPEAVVETEVAAAVASEP